MVRAQYAYREQRKHPRKALHPKAAFALDGGPRIEAFCRDLGLGGAFLETSNVAVFATEVTVYLDLEGHDVAIRSLVRWTGKDGFGVQFGLLGARETSRLVALLGHPL